MHSPLTNLHVGEQHRWLEKRSRTEPRRNRDARRAWDRELRRWHELVPCTASGGSSVGGGIGPRPRSIWIVGESFGGVHYGVEKESLCLGGTEREGWSQRRRKWRQRWEGKRVISSEGYVCQWERERSNWLVVRMNLKTNYESVFSVVFGLWLFILTFFSAFFFSLLFHGVCCL